MLSSPSPATPPNAIAALFERPAPLEKLDIPVALVRRRQRDQRNSMATKCKQLHFHGLPGKIPHYLQVAAIARSRATASGTLKLSLCADTYFPTAFAVSVRHDP